MKRFISLSVLILTIIAAVFVLNMTVMYAFFNINVLKPRILLQNGMKTVRTGSNEQTAASLGAKADKQNPLWEGNPASQTGHANQAGLTKKTDPAETNIMPKSGASDADRYYMTPDEIAFLDHLDLPDKLSALTILSKLGTEEMDRIVEMSYDGVTFEEFANINSSAEGRLSADDVETLKDILYRNKMLYAENGR